MPVIDRQVEADVAKVSIPSREAQEIRTVPADEDRRAFRSGRARVTGSVPQLVPAAIEGTPAAPQHAHDLDSLSQHRDPLPGGGPAHPEGRCVINGTTSPQAHYDPATGRLIQGGC